MVKRSQPDLHIVENPEPDERSAEEQTLANAVSSVLKYKLVSVAVGSSPPDTPERVVMIGIALWPWQLVRFWRKRSEMLAVARMLVPEEGARIVIERIPFHLTLAFALATRGVTYEDQDGRRASRVSREAVHQTPPKP